MIYLNLRLGKHNFDLKYNRLVKYLNVDFLSCPCCSHNGLERHGYYSRHFLFNSNCTRSSIRILRVRCPDCGSTHAVFVLDLIPFIAAHIDDIEAVTLQFLNNPDASAAELADSSPLGFTLDNTVSRLKIFFLSRLGDCIDSNLSLICTKLIGFLRSKNCPHIGFIDYSYASAYTLA